MSDAVEQIKERLNILDVVGGYVELHRAGKSFKGKSPFSAEKTPSFYVSPERGMYYCFSTSQGGDIFTFIQKMEGVEFKEALKLLAEKAGVELVPEKPEQKTERDRAYAALAAATTFYQTWLTKHPAAYDYVIARGLMPVTIARWQIGYAPGPPQYGWRHTREYLTSEGYATEEQLRVGLIKETGSGKEPFDVFRDRVVFPLCDAAGRVVGFSGRILTKDTEAPKYMNTPDTFLYHKSSLLYGFDKAKEGIRKLDFTLIVEGQFDVVLCHQAGYHNTVAVSGTALTLEHVQQLERFSRRVVLALDADKAGIAAMKRAAEVMLQRGFDIKVAELPDGRDPADIIAADAQAFKKVVGSGVHVIEFLLHVLRRQYADDRAYKLKARDEVLPFVLLLPSRIDQEHFVGVIATALHTSTEAIRFELERLRERVDGPVKPSALADVVTQETGTNNVNQLTELVSYLTGAIPVVAIPYRRALQVEFAAVRALVSAAPEPEPALVARAVFELEAQTGRLTPPQVLEIVVSALVRYRQLLIQHALGQLREQLQTAEAEGEEEQAAAILAKLTEFGRLRHESPYTVDYFIARKD